MEKIFCKRFKLEKSITVREMVVSKASLVLFAEIPFRGKS